MPAKKGAKKLNMTVNKPMKAKRAAEKPAAMKKAAVMKSVPKKKEAKVMKKASKGGNKKIKVEEEEDESEIVEDKIEEEEIEEESEPVDVVGEKITKVVENVREMHEKTNPQPEYVLTQVTSCIETVLKEKFPNEGSAFCQGQIDNCRSYFNIVDGKLQAVINEKQDHIHTLNTREVKLQQESTQNETDITAKTQEVDQQKALYDDVTTKHTDCIDEYDTKVHNKNDFELQVEEKVALKQKAEETRTLFDEVKVGGMQDKYAEDEETNTATGKKKKAKKQPKVSKSEQFENDFLERIEEVGYMGGQDFAIYKTSIPTEHYFWLVQHQFLPVS